MVETYVHHKVKVSVQSHLKGKHRDHCLCFKCSKFKPNTANNCNIARNVFENCIKFSIVTPVYECPEFFEK